MRPCQTSKSFKNLKRMSPQVVKFLQTAHRECPSLFSDAVADKGELFCAVVGVYNAWKNLSRMNASSEKASEADYVANV